MTCSHCHEGALEATQAPQIPAKLRPFLPTAAIGAVLILGGAMGLGLPLMRDAGVDLSWALIAVPVLLVACTPLLVMGALRVMSEKEIWRCTSCGYSQDRT